MKSYLIRPQQRYSCPLHEHSREIKQIRRSGKCIIANTGNHNDSIKPLADGHLPTRVWVRTLTAHLAGLRNSWFL